MKEREEKKRNNERVTERRERTKASKFTTSLPSMRKRSHHQDHNYGQVLVVIAKNQILTCAGVVIVAGAGTGILGAAGVEAAEGCGLELGTGCVEEEGLAVV